MARIIIDSSILISIINEADLHHKTVVEKVGVLGNVYGISTITVTETMVRAYRESDSEADRLRDRIDDAIDYCVDVDEFIAVEAAKIRAQTRLSTPDAIISATAKLKHAQLWTLDKRLAKAHKGAVLIS